MSRKFSWVAYVPAYPSLVAPSRDVVEQRLPGRTDHGDPVRALAGSGLRLRDVLVDVAGRDGTSTPQVTKLRFAGEPVDRHGAMPGFATPRIACDVPYYDSISTLPEQGRRRWAAHAGESLAHAKERATPARPPPRRSSTPEGRAGPVTARQRCARGLAPGQERHYLASCYQPVSQGDGRADEV